MPYRSYFLTPEGRVEMELSEAAVRDALERGEGSLWLDFDIPTAEDREFLLRVFGLHPVAVDSCLDMAAQVPKVDDYDDYIFIVSRGIDYTVDTRILSTAEMGIFLGRNFVISAHSGLLHNIESIATLVERDGLPLRRGATFLTYMLLDSLVLNLVPGINGLEEWVDDIEDSVIERPDPNALEAILDLKRSSFQLRRAIAPQRDMLNRLSRAEFAHVTGDALPYYRDIYDTILRIEGQNETLRDRADTTLSVYLSLVANQQNDLMRVLAVVATVFMPLGLIAGIYGMNFEYIPELRMRWGYFAVLGVMATAIAAVLWVFWARRWISVGRRRLVRFRPTTIAPERLLAYVSKLDPRRIEPVIIDPRRLDPRRIDPSIIDPRRLDPRRPRAD